MKTPFLDSASLIFNLDFEENSVAYLGIFGELVGLCYISNPLNDFLVAILYWLHIS